MNFKNSPESKWLKKAKRRKKYRVFHNLIFWIKLKYVRYLKRYFKIKKENMLYCIVVNRRGIGEENMILHHKFKKEPTREEVLKVIEDADCGYDDNYCKFEYCPITI